MVSRARRPWGVLLAVALLVALPGALPRAASGAAGTVHAASALPGPARVDASTAPAPGRPTVPAGGLSPGACATLRSRFAGLFDGPALPPSVVTAAQDAACPISYDEAGVGLVSGAAGSGARASLALALPNATGGATRALAAFEVGLWVGGVSCSAGGASYLSVDLLPPSGGTNSSGLGANWSVWAPVYDLVPAGGCDPRCQNQTALFVFPGSARAFCEDPAIVRGPLAGNAPVGSFAAGSLLNLTFVGAPGAPDGLSVYLNSTRDPSADLAWGYPGNTTISGAPLAPLFNASTNGSGAFWGLGPALSVRALLCPTAAPGIGDPNACSSYDGPRVNATALPTVVGADSFNATSGRYDVPYPRLLPFSSSLGCDGAPGVAPCSGFSRGGGTGSYPSFGLRPEGGQAALTLGGSDLGSWASFAPGAATSGLSDDLDAVPGAALVPTSASYDAVAGTATFTARIAALAGISSATFHAYFCLTGTTASATAHAASESGGSGNGPGAGNFSYTSPALPPEVGPFFYWWTAVDGGGDTVRTPVANVTVGAGPSNCADPTPATPFFTAANVSALGGGYRLAFAENSSFADAYAVVATPSTGGSPRTFWLNGTGPVDLAFGGDGIAWNLTAAARAISGALSPASHVVAAATALPTLAATVTSSAPGDLWAGSAVPWVNVTATGGVGPYAFAVAFGDGSSFTTTRAVGYLNLTHDFGALDGVGWVTASLVDADGERAVAPPVGVSVLAGPLGVNQSLSAGALDVHLAWSPPLSPAAPVTGYTVFYTNRSADTATLSTLWSVNDTSAGAFLWNTTNLYFDVANVATGGRWWMLVVAWDALGVGLLPAGWLQAPSAIPENLSAPPPTLTPAGGPVPLTVTASDEVTLGTNGTLVEALYSFGSEGSVAANLSSNLSGPLATWWLNASWTFTSAGEQAVVLHVTDAYADTQIPIGFVYVADGGAPTALARVTSQEAAVVGQPVDFEGIAGGGTGSYAYNWSFGDGGNSTEAAPAHTYLAPGNFTAVLTVTDTGDGERAFAEVNLTVYQPPVASISMTATSASGTSYEFRAVVVGGVGGLAYTWTFGDGQLANGPVVDHTYAGAGRFTVNLSVSDALREGAEANVSVVVPSTATPSSGGGSTLTGPELAAFALLTALAAVLFIGLVYFWSKSRGGGDLPPADGPRRGPEPPRVRAPPPRDPPDPS